MFWRGLGVNDDNGDKKFEGGFDEGVQTILAKIHLQW